MKTEICECGHSEGRHLFTGKGLFKGCLHCSCKEFYAREEDKNDIEDMYIPCFHGKHFKCENCDSPKPVEEWPKKHDEYYYINEEGYLSLGYWDNDSIDRFRKDFLGIYRDSKEADAVRDKVREFVRNIKK